MSKLRSRPATPKPTTKPGPFDSSDEEDMPPSAGLTLDSFTATPSSSRGNLNKSRPQTPLSKGKQRLIQESDDEDEDEADGEASDLTEDEEEQEMLQMNKNQTQGDLRTITTSTTPSLSDKELLSTRKMDAATITTTTTTPSQPDYPDPYTFTGRRRSSSSILYGAAGDALAKRFWEELAGIPSSDGNVKPIVPPIEKAVTGKKRGGGAAIGGEERGGVGGAGMLLPLRVVVCDFPGSGGSGGSSSAPTARSLGIERPVVPKLLRGHTPLPRVSTPSTPSTPSSTKINEKQQTIIKRKKPTPVGAAELLLHPSHDAGRFDRPVQVVEDPSLLPHQFLTKTKNFMEVETGRGEGEEEGGGGREEEIGFRFGREGVADRYSGTTTGMGLMSSPPRSSFGAFPAPAMFESEDISRFETKRPTSSTPSSRVFDVYAGASSGSSHKKTPSSSLRHRSGLGLEVEAEEAVVGGHASPSSVPQQEERSIYRKKEIPSLLSQFKNFIS
jgi:hypothetical protein